LRLAEVALSRKQVELEFHLPSRQLDAPALLRTLRHAGQAVPALRFGTLDGYLRGFIDLVFEHGGRYYLLDWKSNHLGDRPQDYAPAALERTMAQQGYHLQALLYALALHRHLGTRLPHYRFELHFGGVLYLFVRGVRPGWTLADGSAAGVHAQRPTRQLLDELSALFDGTGVPA
jgi:exodeoxyribonuclease V beta subunit